MNLEVYLQPPPRGGGGGKGHKENFPDRRMGYSISWRLGIHIQTGPDPEYEFKNQVRPFLEGGKNLFLYTVYFAAPMNKDNWIQNLNKNA